MVKARILNLLKYNAMYCPGCRYVYLLIFFWLFAGCATRVASIYNYSVADGNFQTFTVVPPAERSSQTPENKLFDQRLQDIITTSLENKGLQTSALPDLYVSYTISVYSTSETTSNYNNPYGHNYYNSYYYPSSFDYTTRTYKTGVFLINIKNSRGKLIWQGSKTFKLKSKESVQVRIPEICREVIEVFSLSGS